MATWTEPRTTHHGKQTHLCYDLQHRVNVAKIYPRTASNGSTVLVYGHTNGIRIIWRGGRALKKKAAPKDDGKPKVNGTNGTSSDVVMIDLTSDDESPAQAPPPSAAHDDAEFESEDETNESEPYSHIVQQLDIPLGTEVLSLALPQLPQHPSYKPADAVPPLFDEKIVVSVACADTSVRVITLPLTPPSDARKAADRRKVQAPYAEQILRIEGQHGHQAIPSGITMTWTPNDADSRTDDVDMDDDEDAEDDESEPRPRKRIGMGDVKDWDLVVASHSIEVTGVLHIFRIPISKGDLTTKPIFPYQTQYLPAPATHISFAPSCFPSRRHLHLLVANSKGFVKVYDPLAAQRARPRSARPGMAQLKRLGAWVASFSTSFESVEDKTAHPGLAQRKRILDAKWASDGRSIVALLADGEWGAWDVDGSGPGASKTLNFALRGYIGSSEEKEVSAPLVSAKTGSRGLALAPMTPNTRRHREESLFRGPITSATSEIPRGGISVASSVNRSSGQPEDALVLWYCDEVFRIPNFQQYWQRNSGSKNSSGSLYGPSLTRVEGITLNGEPINGIEQFAREGTAARMGVPRDLLIQGSTRLLFVVHATPQTKTSGGLFANLDSAERHVQVDNELLKRGELDLGGMDRILNGMSGEAAPTNRNPMLRLGNKTAAAANTRKVGFAGLGSSR